MDEIWHYGKNLKNGKGLIKLSRRSKPVETIIPTNEKEITDIYSALAKILLTSQNLQRVSGYYCDNHRKFHRFTFHNQVSFTIPFMYGCDSKSEVINFAKSLF